MNDTMEKYTTPEATVKEPLSWPVRAPFGYYGAKQRLASKIVKGLPPHYAWVEAFCGSAAITLAKKPAPIEIINDLDDLIINFFEQLRTNHKALCEAIALTPYARAEYQKARISLGEGNSLEKARQFLVATMMTVNGTIGSSAAGFSYSSSYSRGGCEARVNRWYNLPDRLAQVAERLKNVRIEKKDARELLELFINRPATLVYLDPPYFVRRDHQYIIDAKDEQFHIELLKLCRKAKCMILLSGYESRLYNEMLSLKSGWTQSVIQTHIKDISGNCHSKTEVLWTNKQYNKANLTGRVPIRLSIQEKKNKKLNPPRGDTTQSRKNVSFSPRAKDEKRG